MNRRKPDNSLGTGVYFATGDYVGLGRRLVILVIDIAVLGAGVVALDVASSVWLFSEETYGMLNLGGLLLAYLYLTVIKASRLRTLGYRMVGARIVTLKGERPSVFRMTFRLFLWVFGPLNVVADLIWLGVDRDRQSLRDHFAGTFVVKASAAPIGEGPIHLAYVQAFALSLMLPTVTRPREPAESA